MCICLQWAVLLSDIFFWLPIHHSFFLPLLFINLQQLCFYSRFSHKQTLTTSRSLPSAFYNISQRQCIYITNSATAQHETPLQKYFHFDAIYIWVENLVENIFEQDLRNAFAGIMMYLSSSPCFCKAVYCQYYQYWNRLTYIVWKLSELYLHYF